VCVCVCDRERERESDVPHETHNLQRLRQKNNRRIKKYRGNTHRILLDLFRTRSSLLRGAGGGGRRRRHRLLQTLDQLDLLPSTSQPSRLEFTSHFVV